MKFATVVTRNNSSLRFFLSTTVLIAAEGTKLPHLLNDLMISLNLFVSTSIRDLFNVQKCFVLRMTDGMKNFNAAKTHKESAVTKCITITVLFHSKLNSL